MFWLKSLTVQDEKRAMTETISAAGLQPQTINAWALVFSRHNLLPLAVWLVMLVLIAAYWLPYRGDIQRQQQQIFKQHSAQLVEDLERRLSHVEQLVSSGTAFVTASSDVQQRDWQSFTEALGLEQNYPGIQSFGIVRLLSASEIGSFKLWMQTQGVRDFSIYPTGERHSYAVVSHIQPFTNLNRSVLGYDLFSDQMRRQTSLRAASFAQSALTPAVTLVQDPSGNAQPGLILLQPVYRSGVPLLSAEQKLQSLQYFVYAAFRVRDLLTALWPAQNASGLAFRWYDVTQGSTVGHLYQSFELESPSPFRQQIQLELYGQPFILEIHAPAAFVRDHLPHMKLIDLVTALVFSLLVFMTSSLVNLRRYQAIVMQKQLTEQLQWQHQQLFANEHRQALVLKASQLIWFEFDLTTGDGFYSDSCWRLLGYQRPLSTARQHLLTDAMPSSDALIFQQDLQLLMATTIDDFSQHYQLINRQGQRLDCRFQLYLWRDQSGDAQSLFGIISDQTAWQQQQDKRQALLVIFQYNQLQALKLLEEPSDQTSSFVKEDILACRQAQRLHLQHLVQLLGQDPMDVLKLPLPAQDEMPSAVDIARLVQALWPLFVVEGRAQQTQLQLGYTLTHRAFCCHRMAIRQYVSLLFDAGLTFGVSERPFLLQRLPIPDSEVLSFDFEVEAEFLPQLRLWQLQAEDCMSASLAVAATLKQTPEDKLAILMGSFQLWAALMDGHFSLELIKNSPVASHALPSTTLCQLQLRLNYMSVAATRG
jgi:CHASE1-domain containing sensor protein